MTTSSALTMSMCVFPRATNLNNCCALEGGGINDEIEEAQIRVLKDLDERLHLDGRQHRKRKQPPDAANFDPQQAACFKHSMFCFLNVMLASPRDDDGVCPRQNAMMTTMEKEGDRLKAMGAMLHSVAERLTENHRPRYMSASIVHSNLHLHKIMSVMSLRTV